MDPECGRLTARAPHSFKSVGASPKCLAVAISSDEGREISRVWPNAKVPPPLAPESLTSLPSHVPLPSRSSFACARTSLLVPGGEALASPPAAPSSACPGYPSLARGRGSVRRHYSPLHLGTLSCLQSQGASESAGVLAFGAHLADSARDGWVVLKAQVIPMTGSHGLSGADVASGRGAYQVDSARYGQDCFVLTLALRAVDGISEQSVVPAVGPSPASP